MYNSHANFHINDTYPVYSHQHFHLLPLIPCIILCPYIHIIISSYNSILSIYSHHIIISYTFTYPRAYICSYHIFISHIFLILIIHIPYHSYSHILIIYYTFHAYVTSTCFFSFLLLSCIYKHLMHLMYTSHTYILSLCITCICRFMLYFIYA